MKNSSKKSLNAVLGRSGRVKKPKPRPGGPDPGASPSGSPSSSPGARRTPAATPRPRTTALARHASSAAGADAQGQDYFGDRLADLGLAHALATDLTLSDVPQALRYARQRMFDPLPARAGGISSTRTGEILRFRARLPPVLGGGHLEALLRSPTAVAREAAALRSAGVLRKLVSLRRGVGAAEAYVLAADYERLVREAEGVDEDVKAEFLGWLGRFPVATCVVALPDREEGLAAPGGGQPGGGGGAAGDGLSTRAVDQLVRAGFLTAGMAREYYYATTIAGGGGGGRALLSRPEDRATLTSLERVSRAASGSVDAVGGRGAVFLAGGGGGSSNSASYDASRDGGEAGGAAMSSSLPSSRRRSTRPEAEELSLAVPGHGVQLKLAAAAVDHLAALLGRSQFREMPESRLRGLWDGHVGADETRRTGRAGTGAHDTAFGVLPGRTKKWKDFWGLAFGWVLAEAVGTGVVEVFETGTVGRGVRMV